VETKILRLLIVDDSPDDAEIAVVALRKGGYMLKSQRINDLLGLQTALEKGEWDIVISEYQLPHFGATLVLEWLKRAQLKVPMIVLARAIRDPEIIKIMQAGARDVVLKDQSARLLPAIEREIAVAAERAEYQRAAKSLKEIEHTHRTVIDSAREAICYSQDGMHVNANKAYLELFEYDSLGELEGVPLMNLIDKPDHARFKDAVRKVGTHDGPQEFTAVRKNGGSIPVEITMSHISIDGEPCLQVLVNDISKRRAVETKLRYLNEHDPLTGLYNRHYFSNELNRAIERANRDDVVSGIVYADFSDLRQVSKTQGHTAADRVLLAAAHTLRDTFGERAVLARWGDHEFAALVTELTPAQLQELAANAELTLNSVAFKEDGMAVKSSCRVVAVIVDRNAQNGQHIMAQLYGSAEPPATAKPTAPTLNESTSDHPTATPTAATTPATPAAAATPGTDHWHGRIQQALEREAFELHYQPMINLHGDPAEYFEVLVRMVADGGQLIAAGEFLPAAEASGQSVAIDRWVVRHAILALAEMHRQKRKATFFVNVSAKALQDPGLVVSMQRWLKENTLRGKYLALEVDESAILAHPAAAGAFVRAASKAGCSFCIDNIGRTATDAHWRDLPAQYLKIAAALLQDAVRDEAGKMAFKAVVDNIKAMERKAIAKGVESAGTLSLLWTLGIDYAQGHYFEQVGGGADGEFESETTLSSDNHTPNWATVKNKNH
jgi:multidomain signaling protein FimX